MRIQCARMEHSCDGCRETIKRMEWHWYTQELRQKRRYHQRCMPKEYR